MRVAAKVDLARVASAEKQTLQAALVEIDQLGADVRSLAHWLVKLMDIGRKDLVPKSSEGAHRWMQALDGARAAMSRMASVAIEGD